MITNAVLQPPSTVTLITCRTKSCGHCVRRLRTLWSSTSASLLPCWLRAAWRSSCVASRWSTASLAACVAPAWKKGWDSLLLLHPKTYWWLVTDCTWCCKPTRFLLFKLIFAFITSSSCKALPDAPCWIQGVPAALKFFFWYIYIYIFKVSSRAIIKLSICPSF